MLGDWINVLSGMPSDSIDCCVTSPPYFSHRDYQVEGQLGQESTPAEYVAKLVEGFNEVRRVLKPTGSLWLNLGDSYASQSGGYSDNDGYGNSSVISASAQSAVVPNKNRKLPGLKPKDLIMIPAMVAIALRDSGYYLRSDIIWEKPNSMPASATDRCTNSHEHLFLLTKNNQYFYDAEAIKERCSEANINDFLARKTLDNKGRGKKGTYDEARPDLTRSREAYMPKDFMRNKRSVWRVGEGGEEIWRWLFENTTEEFFYPLLEKFISESENKNSVWSINTKPFKGAHFACFPQELIIDCIKAGSSEYGCCADCGAPWERIVERTAGESVSCPKTDAAHIARGGVGKPSGTVGKSGGGRINGTTETIGWQPTCKCDTKEIVPSIILDCFGGAATTGVVARKLNRNFILIELNPEYVQIGNDRLSAELGMFL